MIADDLTGALDAALLLHAAGVRAPVLVGLEAYRKTAVPPPTVILDVDSRGDSPEVAYSKVREAARTLLGAEYSRLYKKMSSTFQGHVGREVDAVMDETGADFAVVTPAFPSNGRIVSHGTLYVNGVPLAETGVGRHPTSPITDSYLPRVLQAQTTRKVGLVEIETVRGGPDALREAFTRLSGSVQMAIADAESEEDLKTLAEACGGLTVTAGGSAFAGKLPLGGDRSNQPVPRVPKRSVDGILVLAGSVSPITASQVSYALDHGLDGLALDPVDLQDDEGCGREVARAVDFVLKRLRDGRSVMVYTPQDTASQVKAADHAREIGISVMESGLAIAGCVSEVAARVIAATGLNRLIVAGGDTSSTVCRRLGLDRHEVIEEIQAGVPLSLSSGRQDLVTVLKSGNFGTEDFLIQALSRLKKE